MSPSRRDTSDSSTGQRMRLMSGMSASVPEIRQVGYSINESARRTPAAESVSGFQHEEDRSPAEADDRLADVGEPGAAADGRHADGQQRRARAFERRFQQLV